MPAEGRYAGIAPSRPCGANAAIRAGIDTSPRESSACAAARASISRSRSRQASTSARVRTSIHGGRYRGRARGRLRVDEHGRGEEHRHRDRALGEQRTADTRPDDVEPRHDDELMDGAPEQGDRDEPELDEQHVALAARPGIGGPRREDRPPIRPRPGPPPPPTRAPGPRRPARPTVRGPKRGQTPGGLWAATAAWTSPPIQSVAAHR